MAGHTPGNAIVGKKGFQKIPLASRFWSKVGLAGPYECWPWNGSRCHGDYGRIWLDGRLQPAHRIAYELVVEPVPKGLVLDHLCRNPPCVNPAHLEPVTQLENMRRADFKTNHFNANKTHCKRGHELSGDNLKYKTHGQRQCQECRRIRDRKYRAQRKAKANGEGRNE